MMKLKDNIPLALAVVLFVGSTFYFAEHTAHADISNPHSLPPNNSITNAMLKSSIIENANVDTVASIQITKLGQVGDNTAVPFGGGTNLATSSNFTYNSGTNQLKVGSVNATNGQVCNNGTCYTLPATDGSAGYFLKTDGNKNLSFVIPPFVGSTSVATSSTSGTFTLPSGFTHFWVQAVGGGGGGGSNSSACGAGGGAGGYAAISIATTTNISYTIGAAGSVGGGGGATTVGGILTANGGSGGQSVNPSVLNAHGGIGGTATGGQINIAGGTGSSASGNTGTCIMYGAGGTSVLGGGGSSDSATSAGNGGGGGGGQVGGVGEVIFSWSS